MNYAKGLKTQERIYETAKQHFYQYGYRKTTIEKIASQLHIPASLVTYYFKKNELVARIYQDFFQKIYDRVDQKGNLVENGLQRHILFTKILLHTVFSDPNVKAFYIELTKLDAVPQEIHEKVRASQSVIRTEFHLDVTPQQYYQYTVAEYGARSRLLIQYKDLNPADSEFESFAELLATITVRLAGVSKEIIEENVRKARELIESIAYNDITMF